MNCIDSIFVFNLCFLGDRTYLFQITVRIWVEFFETYKIILCIFIARHFCVSLKIFIFIMFEKTYVRTYLQILGFFCGLGDGRWDRSILEKDRISAITSTVLVTISSEGYDRFDSSRICVGVVTIAVLNILYILSDILLPLNICAYSIFQQIFWSWLFWATYKPFLSSESSDNFKIINYVFNNKIWYNIKNK